MFSLFVLALDYAFYPEICPLKPEELIVCTGNTYTFTLTAADMSNSGFTCSTSTTPESCTFVLLSSTTTLTLTSSGTLKYTPTSSDIDSTFLVGVYDANAMGSVTTFNYLSMTQIYELKFDIREPSSMPTVTYDTYSSSCSTCSDCSTCVSLECNVPKIGQLKVSSVSDPDRFKYTLLESNKAEIVVLTNGYFYIEPISCGEKVNWTITVYDKASDCSKDLFFGNFYLNSAPVITVETTICFVDYESLSFNVSVSDDLSSEFTLTISSSTNNEFTYTWVTEKIFKIETDYIDQSVGNSVISVYVNDSGFDGTNVMQSVAQVYLHKIEFEGFEQRTEIVLKYAGDWTYSPEFNQDGTFVEIETTASGLYLINNKTGRLVWEEDDIMQATTGVLLSITYKFYTTNCTIYSTSYSAKLFVQVQDPPVIMPLPPINIYTGIEITRTLSIHFHNISLLSFTFKNFSPVLTITDSTASIKWTEYSKTSANYTINITTDTYLNRNYYSSTSFLVTVYDPEDYIIVVPKLVAVSTDDYSIDLKIYSNLTYVQCLLFSLESIDSGFSLSEKGILSASSSKLGMLGSEAKVELNLKIFSSLSDKNFTFFVEILILKKNFSVDFSLAQFVCGENVECTFDLSLYLSNYDENITDYYYTNLPEDQDLNYTDNIITWKPSNLIGSSGYITLTVTILNQNYSDSFLLKVFKNPLIQELLYTDQYIPIGLTWEKNFKVISQNNEPVFCTFTTQESFTSSPVFDSSTKSLTWSPVNNLLTTGEYSSNFTGAISCSLEFYSFISSSYTFSLPFYKTCEISEIEINYGLPFEQWASNITVTFYNPSFWLNFKVINFPLGLSVEYLSTSGNSNYYELRYYKEDNQDLSLELQCTEYFVDKPSLSSTSVKLVYYGDDVPEFSINECENNVIMGRDYLCEIPVKFTQVCEITQITEDSVEISVSQIKIIYSDYKCLLTWAQSSLNLYVQKCIILNIKLSNYIGTHKSKNFELCPNDQPTVIGLEDEYYVSFGGVFFSLNLNVSDMDSFNYSLITGPSGLTLSNTGKVNWKSPIISDSIVTRPVEILITDNAKYPLSSTAAFNIITNSTSPNQIPVCKENEKIIVGQKWTYSITVPSTANFSFNSGKIMFNETESYLYYTASKADPIVLTLKFTYFDSEPECTMTLEPNHLPGFLNCNDFTHNLKVDFSYRFSYFDDDESVDNLIFQVFPQDTNIVKIDKFGLVYWNRDEMSAGYFSFYVSITDNHAVPGMDICHVNFTIYKNGESPVFILPIMNVTYPIKQYLLSSSEYSSEIFINGQIYDADTDLANLTLEIVGFNHNGVELKWIPENGPDFLISWTPEPLESTTGLVTIKVYESNSPSNYDLFEIITLSPYYDYAPEFRSALPNISIFDDEETAFNIYYQDPDSLLSSITITISPDQFSIKGLDAFYRPKSVISGVESGIYFISICSNSTSCTTNSGFYTVTHRLIPPVLNILGNTIFQFNDNKTYNTAWTIQAIGYNNKQLTYCVWTNEGNGEVKLNEDNSINFILEAYEDFYLKVNVTVTEGNCTALELSDSVEIVFCIEFLCSSLIKNTKVSYSDTKVLMLTNLNSEETVYIRNSICEFLNISESVYYCSVPSDIILGSTEVFIKNTNGLSKPLFFEDIQISRTAESLSATINPESGQGLPNEVIKITLSSSITGRFRCILIPSSSSQRYEGVLYTLDNKIFYCILPELPESTYSVALAEIYLKKLYYTSNYSVKGILEIQEKLSDPLIGHNQGGYKKSIDIDKKSWPFPLFLRFGETHIIQTLDSESFTVPARVFDSKVNIYISPSMNPYFWSNSTLSFEYSGECLADGKYCEGSEIKKSEPGFYVPTMNSTAYMQVWCLGGSFQLNIQSNTCDLCQVGYMCPSDGLSDQLECEAGFICDRSQISTPFIACPPGFYCQSGTNTQKVENFTNYFERLSSSNSSSTEHWFQYGTFNQISGTYNSSIPFVPDCISQYFTGHEEATTLIPPILCPEDFYCLFGTKTSNSSKEDTWFTPQSCTQSYVCLEGAGESFDNIRNCKVGYFCPGKGYAGDYCDDSDASCSQCKCLPGNSCPYKSLTSPIPCSPGSYQGNCTGSTCLECDKGYYCNETGLTAPVGICTKGYYCEAGSSAQIPCPSGFYNNKEGQAECLECPLGTYCPNQGTSEPLICTSGYICNDTQLSSQIPCPSGYYCNDGTDYAGTNECPPNKTCPIKCEKGTYCPEASNFTSLCAVGYYQDKAGQDSCKSCSQGFYCPEQGLTQMTICPAGYYCHQEELGDIGGVCPAGFYCLEGAVNYTSSYSVLNIFECSEEDLVLFYGNRQILEPIPCPPGTFCSQQTSTGMIGEINGPVYCQEGFYNDRCGQSECFECPPGYSCEGKGTVIPKLCPEGFFRSGILEIECLGCPEGTWSNGQIGLATSLDCASCPEGYICNQVATKDFSEMIRCPAGYYCPSGSSSNSLLCPAGFMCPPGLSDKNKTAFVCPAGLICRTGTAVEEDALEDCIVSSPNCVIGSKCPQGYFCSSGTSGKGEICPSGSTSSESSQSIFDCYPQSDLVKVYASDDIISYLNISSTLSLDPLSYTRLKFNNFQYPEGTNPTDYSIVLIIQGEVNYKVPLIQSQNYKPVFRIPLPHIYSANFSDSNTEVSLSILAHKKISVYFNVEILNSRYVYPQLRKLFNDSVFFISTEYSERFNHKSFLAVLNRNSKDVFKEPSNLDACKVIVDGDESLYFSDTIDLIESASVSVLGGVEYSESEFYPQTTYELWNSLSFDQKLYPLDYLPYVTDCDEYGSYIPIYLLFTNSKCDFKSSEKTEFVSIIEPFKKPNGDYCNYNLTCRISEKVSNSESLSNWFESYHLSSTKIFYFTRKQLSGSFYSNSIPSKSAKENSFSKDYYGTGNIIGVSSVRLDSNYKSGMIPKKVKLFIGYFQKNIIDKEILTSTIYFSEFTSDLSNREYNFEFELKTLGWKDCLDLFAFEEYLYYVFVMVLCLVIFVLIVIFWVLNYVFSTILPRPSLKIKLYMNYSIRIVKGVLMSSVPTFAMIMCFYYVLSSFDFIKEVPGSFFDTQAINPSSSADSTRVTKYVNGRLGTCLSVLGVFLVYQSSSLIFSKISVIEDKSKIPELNSQIKKLHGQFLWSTVPVTIFCLLIYYFAKSEHYLSLQALYIFIFKLTNTRLVELNRQIFNDELYVLPLYGVMTLTVMLVTMQIGAFTAFLSGYLTNILIRIAKRTFIEPYRIQIKNQILRLKQRFKIQINLDPTLNLSFKDRVYIEQISDLGINSVESIVAWLFPILIVFNYVFYTELQLEIAKDFLKYFIVFCFMQAFADIGYDIFLNNAIECRTGRLLSEKIIELRGIFEGRKSLWSLSDKTPHNGKELVSSLDNLLRIGFSTQYSFIVSMSILGLILQVYAVELWENWSYIPFEDPIFFFIIPFTIVCCVAVTYALKKIGKVLKIWKIKPKNSEKPELSLREKIKFYMGKVIENSPALTKEDVFYDALTEGIIECYDREISEVKRKAAILEFLSSLDKEITKKSESICLNVNELPLPKIREKNIKRVPINKKKIDVREIKPVGTWPAEFNFKWD